MKSSDCKSFKEEIIMYKDIIERDWFRKINKPSLKAKKKKKVYYDKPYIAEHTENTELIDYETFKKMCKTKLTQISSSFTYPFKFGNEYYTRRKILIDSMPFLPSYTPFEITSIESMVYDTSNGYPNEIPSFKKFEIPNLDLYLKFQEESSPMELDMRQLETYAKMYLNSRYGGILNNYSMTGKYDKNYHYSDYSFDRKHFVIIIDHWRIHVRTDLTITEILGLVHNLYYADIISFNSIKDITMDTFVKEVIHGEIISKKRKLLTDALLYKKPCKIRQKIFEFINEIPEQYWIEYDNLHSSSIEYIGRLASRIISNDPFNNDTTGTIRDIKVRLIDMINKYDIIDNNEDILL